jgi:hypothetical protein
MSKAIHLGFILSFRASSLLQTEENQCFFGKALAEDRLSLLCERLFSLVSPSFFPQVDLMFLQIGFHLFYFSLT